MWVQAPSGASTRNAQPSSRRPVIRRALPGMRSGALNSASIANPGPGERIGENATRHPDGGCSAKGPRNGLDTMLGMPDDVSTQGSGPVVFCYDGSDHAKSAIEQAGQLLSGRPALVLTVWQPLGAIPFFGGAAMPQVPREVVEAAAEEAGKLAAEGAELATAAGFDAKPIVDEGSPVWDRIAIVAEREKAAVVVLGSHGRSGLTYAAMGSVATSVAHHIKRPVLITRLP